MGKTSNSFCFHLGEMTVVQVSHRLRFQLAKKWETSAYAHIASGYHCPIPLA